MKQTFRNLCMFFVMDDMKYDPSTFRLQREI